MNTKFLFSMASVTFAVILTLSCFGDDGIDGSSCIVKPNEKEPGFDVFCDGEPVGVLLNGKDGKMECIIETSQDDSNRKDVFCNGEMLGSLKDGEQGESCDAVEDEAYFVIKCGDIEKGKIAKAMCGTRAYDPNVRLCDFRDGKTYKYVKIGEQIWMTENLNYALAFSKCYDDDIDNCTNYGRLYNWAMALALPEECFEATCGGISEKHPGVCPAGWHVPSSKEWDILINYVGGASDGGKKLKSKTSWSDYMVDGETNAKSGNGTDDYGFTGLPGGLFNNSASFNNIGKRINWWTTYEGTYMSSYIGSIRGLYHDSDEISVGLAQIQGKTYYNYVRCIMN